MTTTTIDKLVIDEDYNLRDLTTKENKAHVEELAASIAASGIRVPVTVRKDTAGRLILVQGHCRLAAIKSLPEAEQPKEIPYIVDEYADDEIERTKGLILTNSGKQYDPLEKGLVFLRLQKQGLKNAEIARTFGMTEGRGGEVVVGQYTRLASVPSAAKCIRTGLTSPTEASEILKEHFSDSKSKSKAEAFFAKQLQIAKPFKRNVLDDPSEKKPEFLGAKATESYLDLLVNIARGDFGDMPEELGNAMTEVFTFYKFDPSEWYVQREADNEAREATERAKEERREAREAEKAAKKKERDDAAAAKKAKAAAEKETAKK